VDSSARPAFRFPLPFPEILCAPRIFFHCGFVGVFHAFPSSIADEEEEAGGGGGGGGGESRRNRWICNKLFTRSVRELELILSILSLKLAMALA
jgi:hypothetical protein